MHMYTYTHIHIYRSEWIIFIHIYVYIYRHIYIYVHMYTYMYIHMHMYTYTHLIYQGEPGPGGLWAGSFLPWASTPSWELGAPPRRPCGRPKGAPCSSYTWWNSPGESLRRCVATKGFACSNRELLALWYITVFVVHGDPRGSWGRPWGIPGACPDPFHGDNSII